MKRLGLLVAVGALVSVFLWTLLGQDSAGDQNLRWVGATTIEVPDRVSAGDPVDLVIAAPTAVDGTQIEIAAFAAFETRTLSATVTNGVATVQLPGSATVHRGLISFVADGMNEPALTHVEPGPAVEPVIPLVGPRTIIADGNDISMIVVSPQDEFGNALNDGTIVSFVIEQPNKPPRRQVSTISGGVAHSLYRSNTVASRLTVSSTIDGADGPSATLDQVAGAPAPFSVTIDGPTPLADQFSLHQMTTSALLDVEGNLLPDGIDVLFVIESSLGRSIVESTVQQGIARGFMQAPGSPGQVRIHALISGRSSTEAAVDFDSAVAESTARLDEAEQKILVGPATSTRGGYLPDGTTVELIDDTNGALIASTELRGGHAEIGIDSNSPIDALVVTILGTTWDVR